MASNNKLNTSSSSNPNKRDCSTTNQEQTMAILLGTARSNQKPRGTAFDPESKHSPKPNKIPYSRQEGTTQPQNIPAKHTSCKAMGRETQTSTKIEPITYKRGKLLWIQKEGPMGPGKAPEDSRKRQQTTETKSRARRQIVENREPRLATRLQ